MGVVNLGVGMGGSIRIFVPDTYPKVSLRLRVPPKGQGYPVGMPRSQNVSTGDPVHVEYVFLVSDLVFNNIW